MAGCSGLAASLPVGRTDEDDSEPASKRRRLCSPAPDAAGSSQGLHGEVIGRCEGADAGTAAAATAAAASATAAAASAAAASASVAAAVVSADMISADAGACRRAADSLGGDVITTARDGDGEGARVDLTAAWPSLAECGSTASELTPKRTYKCRRGCGVAVSSASNRLRHERVKHPLQSSAAAAPVRGLQLPPPRPRLQGAGARVVSTSMQPELLPRRHSNRLESPFRFGAAALDDDDDERKYDSDGADEEEDVELHRFAATATLMHAADSSRPDNRLSTTPTSDDGDGTGAERKDEAHVSSGSELSPRDDSSAGSEGCVQGMPVLFSDEELQAGCMSFLQWCVSPALTPAEAVVKKRGRITSDSQLQPIKSNLRFLMSMAAEKGLTAKVDLQIFTRLDVSQALFSALEERRVGAGRFHALFLLQKKILISLASQESTRRRQYISPLDACESFVFVDSVCCEAGQKRKIDARNRALLGVQATRQLQGEHARGRPPQPFRIPTTWSPPSGSSSPASADDNRTSPTPSARAFASPAASGAAAAHVVPHPSDTPSCNELTKAELQQVCRYCITQLRDRMAAPQTVGDAVGLAVSDRFFQALVVVATLCLGLAPRSQVLRALKIGSSFTRHADDGLYWIKLVAQQTKSGTKPTLFALPAELTPVYDFFLDTVRPRLLAPTTGAQQARHDYLFVKRDGSPRTEFSRTCTQPVTLAAISRPVNSHAFRGAVVVTYYEETGASQCSMNLLADIMGHSAAVAKAYYYRPQFSKAALQTNAEMAKILLHTGPWRFEKP